MLDFVTRTADLGTTGPLAKRKRTHQGQTVTAMREDIIERAQATIVELKAHTSGTLRAPMARSIRNGIAIKIGYGKRNVGFYTGEGDNRIAVIPELHFAHDRKLLAIDYLEQAIAAVQAGEFDALLSKTLDAMAARFQPEREERQLPQNKMAFDKTDSTLLLMNNAA